MRQILVALTIFVALIIVILAAWMLWRPAPLPSTDAPALPRVETLPSPEPTSTPTPTTESRLIMSTTASPTARIDEILAAMSVEEKVGQLFMVYFRGSRLSDELRQMIEDYHIGGIVLFAIAGNIESPRQVAALINDAQSLATTSGAQIPLFISIDQEGGTVVRLTEGFTVFPSQMAVGATGSTDMAARMAEVTAQELKALGINMNLAPVLDVNNNPDNPVIGLRSFGSSPDLVSALGTAMIERYRQMGVIPTAKHFPGHGDTAVDSHYGLPVVPHDRAHLDQIEFPPFRAAIAAGVPAIMTAHVLFPAIDANADSPATLSPPVLQGLLREEMGFDGLIVTDSLSMGALANLVGTTEAAQLAFRAGADVLAYGADIGHSPDESLAAHARLLGLVQSGEISGERLDASVRRILSVKMEYGLLDWQPTNLDAIADQVGSAEHRAVAAEIARRSITLVRDQGDLLPLRDGEQVLVAWPSEIGDLGERLAFCRKDLILRPIGLNPNATEIEQILADAPIAAKIVIGTVNARRFPAQVQLIDALADRPLIVAALGEPYDLLAFAQVGSYLATYGAHPASLDALAQILCGEIEPYGTLPVEVPGLHGVGAADD